MSRSPSVERNVDKKRRKEVEEEEEEELLVKRRRVARLQELQDLRREEEKLTNLLRKRQHRGSGKGKGNQVLELNNFPSLNLAPTSQWQWQQWHQQQAEMPSSLLQLQRQMAEVQQQMMHMQVPPQGHMPPLQGHMQQIPQMPTHVGYPVPMQMRQSSMQVSHPEQIGEFFHFSAVYLPSMSENLQNVNALQPSFACPSVQSPPHLASHGQDGKKPPTNDGVKEVSPENTFVKTGIFKDSSFNFASECPSEKKLLTIRGKPLFRILDALGNGTAMAVAWEENMWKQKICHILQTGADKSDNAHLGNAQELLGDQELPSGAPTPPCSPKGLQKLPDCWHRPIRGALSEILKSGNPEMLPGRPEMTLPLGDVLRDMPRAKKGTRGSSLTSSLASSLASRGPQTCRTTAFSPWWNAEHKTPAKAHPRAECTKRSVPAKRECSCVRRREGILRFAETLDRALRAARAGRGRPKASLVLVDDAESLYEGSHCANDGCYVTVLALGKGRGGTLLSCGDVESNPGPAGPMFADWLDTHIFSAHLYLETNFVIWETALDGEMGLIRSDFRRMIIAFWKWVRVLWDAWRDERGGVWRPVTVEVRTLTILMEVTSGIDRLADAYGLDLPRVCDADMVGYVPAWDPLPECGDVETNPGPMFGTDADWDSAVRMTSVRGLLHLAVDRVTLLGMPVFENCAVKLMPPPGWAARFLFVEKNSAWGRDLTMDGDVEPNPGPMDFLEFVRKYEVGFSASLDGPVLARETVMARVDLAGVPDEAVVAFTGLSDLPIDVVMQKIAAYRIFSCCRLVARNNCLVWEDNLPASSPSDATVMALRLELEQLKLQVAATKPENKFLPLSDDTVSLFELETGRPQWMRRMTPVFLSFVQRMDDTRGEECVRELWSIMIQAHVEYAAQPVGSYRKAKPPPRVLPAKMSLQELRTKGARVVEENTARGRCTFAYLDDRRYYISKNQTVWDVAQGPPGACSDCGAAHWFWECGTGGGSGSSSQH